jgi:hypothetical protein
MFCVRLSVRLLHGGSNGVGYLLAGRSRDVHTELASKLDKIIVQTESRPCRRQAGSAFTSGSIADKTSAIWILVTSRS